MGGRSALWLPVGLSLAAAACSSSGGGAGNGPTDGGGLTDIAIPTDSGTADGPMASNPCALDAGGSRELTALHTGASQVLSMQVASGSLYFADSEGVWGLPTSGGTATLIAAVTSGADMTAFAVTAAHVVWADLGQASFGPTLHAKPLAGGVTIDLDSSGELSNLATLAATDTTVYPNVAIGVSLLSIPLDGGAGTVLVQNTDLSGLLVVASDVYFANGFSGQPPNELLRVPFSGGTPDSLAATGQGGANSMSADGQHLYFSGNLNQEYSLQAWPLSGGEITTLFSSSEDTSILTSANGRAYFVQTTMCGGAPPVSDVWEIGADKSGLQKDESGLDMATAIAADSTYVYVATLASDGSAHIDRFTQ